MRFVVVLLFVVVGGVTACGDGGSAPAAVDADQGLVGFEADWQCERERHAFDELADLDARLAATREAAGISAEDYDEFLASLADDAELRRDVLAAYRAVCS